MVPKTLALFTACLAGMVSAAVALLEPQPAIAQRVVKKLGNICPLGYIDTFNGRCSTLGLALYTMQPSNDQPCPEGWLNVGGGYCRKK